MANTDSSAPSAHPSPDEKRLEELGRLEERYRHELLSDEAREALRDEVLRLRRRLRLS